MIATSAAATVRLTIDQIRRLARGMDPEARARFLLSCTDILWIDGTRVRSLTHFEKELWYDGDGNKCQCPSTRLCFHSHIRRLAACSPVFEHGSWWVTVITEQKSMLHPGKMLTVSTQWAVQLWQDKTGQYHRCCSCPACRTFDGSPRLPHADAVNAKAGAMPSEGERCTSDPSEFDERFASVFRRPVELAA